jgi:hypothetical protein
MEAYGGDEHLVPRRKLKKKKEMKEVSNEAIRNADRARKKRVRNSWKQELKKYKR